MTWVELLCINNRKKCVCEFFRPFFYSFAVCSLILLSWTWKKENRFLNVHVKFVVYLFDLFELAEEDQKKNSSLLTHIANLPGFDASTARFAAQYSTRCSPEKSVMEIVPTAAELMLPWRRDLYPNQNSGGGTLPFTSSIFFFFSFWFCLQWNRVSISSSCQLYHTHTHTHSTISYC